MSAYAVMDLYEPDLCVSDLPCVSLGQSLTFLHTEAVGYHHLTCKFKVLFFFSTILVATSIISRSRSNATIFHSESGLYVVVVPCDKQTLSFQSLFMPSASLGPSLTFWFLYLTLTIKIPDKNSILLLMFC